MKLQHKILMSQMVFIPACTGDAAGEGLHQCASAEERNWKRHRRYLHGPDRPALLGSAVCTGVCSSQPGEDYPALLTMWGEPAAPAGSRHPA